MVKFIAMVKRKSGVSLDEFSRYWYEKHAPLAMKVTPKELLPKRYVHNYAVTLGGSKEPEFDGIGEVYYADMDAFNRSNEWFFGPGGKVLRDDEENFADKSTRIAVVVDERIIIP